ncbi:HlyD family type I secretion periplasmic adaptor subunit [Sphingomonas piscis]|uniref:Membrane fusion protein (MFP) family protein n=1 Tax=Sphingomonas piscis TaxID=2714943 RepID=A0A6G7YRX8_9SPHN|nr:HlyD family type I secretion periplasmic adaptor subunit [Sphingomonas piscis]QIK79489.1 HlyD family type I secretion periplasmic adaptor subunit [Sphingomonas piscis]
MTEIVANASDFDLTLPAGEPAVTPIQDDPRTEIRFGLIIAAIFFIGFLGWAAFAPLDAAAFAPGRLVVSGQRQTVQHREGGVISEILVKEGSRVLRGQVLVRLAGADVRAQERALSAQAIGLLAQRARLVAEQTGQRGITPPPEFASLPPEDRPAAAEALRIQQNQMRTRAAVLGAQRGALGERSGQAVTSGQGYGKQLVAITEQLRLIEEEISGMREAAEKGFVSMNRLRALERAKADLEGQRGQISATIQQTRGQASETQLQSLEAQSNYYERIASELREVNVNLNDVLPKLAAARDQLARIEIRAPSEGTVVGLTVFTPGGVIQPGQKLMDIVPDQVPLTIEARLSLGDGDDVRPGHRAMVRFDTLHERSLPALQGKVTRVSADALTDEKSGTSFYTAEVNVPLDELKKVADLRGDDALRAGIPVSVTIPIRKRTALQYALEPLTSSFRRSFHEN